MPAPPYPAEWESDVVLADGGTVHLRPIRAGDGDAVRGLFDRLSDESIYLRFFSPVTRPTAYQLERLTEIDYDERMAIGAFLGDDLVAVARYDRIPKTHDAEVAFSVQDDQQGRGLGTILLEHLAAVARTRGVRRFEASTLPNNRRMLDLFKAAGFTVKRTFEGGVVLVEFAITPTERSIERAREREHVSEAASVRRILHPRSIALVGASHRPGTIGHEVFRNLLEFEFQGPVYPVNRTTDHVASVRAYPTLIDVPDAVDLAVITVPAAEVPAVVEQCAEKGVKGLVVITAGFRETSDAGAHLEHDLVAAARHHGMRMIGPNCMGVVNTDPAVRLNATFAPFVPVAGRVAFSSQSGALGIELLARLGALGLGVSTFVSLGNKADISGNDLLQYWDDDPATDVILMYLESFGNPRKFARLARRITKRKPIVAVKSGRSRAGERAASSHTAALASPDVAVDALFRQCGVVRVDTLDELFGAAQVLALQPRPGGRRVGIVTNGGGPGILAADACTAEGLEVPELGEDAQQRLRARLPAEATTRNPVDLIASASADLFEHAVREMLDAPGIDSVLVIFVPPLVTRADDVARAVARASAETDKPIVACFLGREGIPDALRDATRRVPSYAFPEQAAGALAHAVRYAEWRDRAEGTVPALSGIDLARARAVVDRAIDGGHAQWLDPDDAGEVIAAYGIPVVRTARVDDVDEAVAAAERAGFPVALKAGSGAIVHKTDVGGVALHLEDAAAVRDAYRAMGAQLGDSMGGAIVQPMVDPGTELVVGVTHDRSFGPLVLFGMGGVAAELVRDTSLHVLPITDLDAAEAIRGLRTSPLLFGYRGAPAVDTAALEDIVVRVGRLADDIPEIVEMDCNPVIASPSGAVVVDVKVRVAPVSDDPLADVRRLRRTP